MANPNNKYFRHIVHGVNLVPNNTTLVGTPGDIDYSTDTGKFNFYGAAGASPAVTENGVQTLTNKTINGPDNTITNLVNANLSGSAGITGANIASNTIANSNLTQMAAHTFKGNNTGSTGNVLDLTATQLTAELNVFVGDSGSGGTKGLVPAPAAGDAAANKFLKADGTFSSVSGAGITAIGVIDSQTASANGAVITGTDLVMQSASSTRPGLVNNTTQTFTGIKTFQNQINTPSITDNGAGITITTSNNQDLTIRSQGSGRLLIRGNNGTDFIQQGSTPTGTPSGYDTLYFKTDDKPYYRTNGGTEFQLQRAIAPTTTKLTSGSGTYTTPSNALYLKVTIIGGGGGGGQGGSGVTGSGAGGGGGGGVTVTTIPSPGVSYSYTVGVGGTGGTGSGNTAGGTSSFNAVTAPGGGAGGDGLTNSQISVGDGGRGGSGSTGSGSDGAPGTVGTANGGGGGNGGGSFLGGGGAGGGHSNNGFTGQNYGGGGGGGGGESGSGANGAGGVIIVEEFYQ